VAVISVPDNQIEQRIALWFGPGAACYCPQSDVVCIASPDVRKVAILDPATNRLRSTVFVPGAVGSMINVAALGKLYCAGSGSSDSLVSVIDPGRDSLLRTIPVAEGLSLVALRTNGTPKLYGVSEAEQILSVINALSDTVVARIPLVRNVLAAVYDSLDDRMFCVCEGDRNVWVFNCRSDSFVAWRWLAAYPVDLCYVPGHNYICVANENDSLVVIDASTLAILAQIPLLGYPRRVQYCDREDKVYCLLYDTLLAAVSMPLLQIVSRPRVPAGLDRMLYDSIANRLYCLAE
jgi:YVTN family beta-propeller protein